MTMRLVGPVVFYGNGILSPYLVGTGVQHNVVILCRRLRQLPITCYEPESLVEDTRDF